MCLSVSVGHRERVCVRVVHAHVKGKTGIGKCLHSIQVYFTGFETKQVRAIACAAAISIAFQILVKMAKRPVF